MAFREQYVCAEEIRSHTLASRGRVLRPSNAIDLQRRRANFENCFRCESVSFFFVSIYLLRSIGVESDQIAYYIRGDSIPFFGVFTGLQPFADKRQKVAMNVLSELIQ